MNPIRPTGDSGAHERPRFNAFVFALVETRAVFRDVTLDGNTWRDSRSVERRTWVGDFSVGVSAGTRHWQATYAQVLHTREFAGQPDQSLFGSISLAFHY